MPFRDFLVKSVRRPLSVLLGAVTLLLLLACANVANLGLVQGATRGREIALRHALGAGRGRVVRLLLTESVVIALAGGAVGVGLGWVGIRAVAALTPLGINGATEVALDLRVILFAVGASVASGVLFGLAPALRSTSSRVSGRLAEGGKNASAGKESLRTVRVLAVAEVALAVLLVGGAGLVTRSFLLIRDADPGFQRESTLAVQLTVPTGRYAAPADVLAFQDRLLEALEARPEITRAGTVEHLPLDGTSWSSQFQAAGWPPERVGFEILHRRTDRGFFEAMGTPLLRGRMYDERDGPDAPPVVLINETFAREHFPGEDPLGQRIAFDRTATATSRWYEIIGVVRDQAQVSPALAPRAEVFEHRLQSVGRSQWIVMRVAGAPETAVPVVRTVLGELDPTIPLTRVRPLQEVWRSSMAREEFVLTLMSAFGALALILSTIGVYGVVAQAARRRTREMGIRMALGAGARQVQLLVLRQGLGLAVAGVLLGVLGMLAGGGVLRGLLFGVAPNDPATLAAVGGLLAATVLLACWVPAWRATRVDLVRSLTTE
jgi:putative ABC transport system permease protein